MTEKQITELHHIDISGSEFKDKILMLYWIQGISAKPPDNYYEVLFQVCQSNKYVKTNIFPEYSPSLGTFYKNGREYGVEQPIGQKISISIDESKRKNTIKRISQIIYDTEYNLNTPNILNGEKRYVNIMKNKLQYCIVFENSSQVIIFPCSVIGARYYFTSTAMRRQIFAHHLDGLYEGPININDDGEAKIIIKSGVPDSDAKYIILFAKDEYAKKQWLALKNNLLKEKKLLIQAGRDSSVIPLFIDFPFAQTMNMDVRVLRFKNNYKEKILVLEILKERASIFNFKKITLIRREHRKAINTKVIMLEDCKTADSITTKEPAYNLKPIKIKNIGEDNIEELQIEIQKEYLPPKDSETIAMFKRGNQKIDVSSAQPHISGDTSTRFGLVERVTEEDNLRNKEVFTLDDFVEMVKGLKFIDGVTDFLINPKSYIPLRGKKILSLKEYYDKENKKRRLFIHVTFDYKGYSVCLVEIDQNKLPSGTSTYILVSGKGSFDYEDVKSLLRLYVNNTEIEDIVKEFSRQDIRFLCKNHPKAKKEELYERWRRTLLQKI